MSMKEEVLKEITDNPYILGAGYLLEDIKKAIDLTQQKMIEEFKEKIDKNVKIIEERMRIMLDGCQLTPDEQQDYDFLRGQLVILNKLKSSLEGKEKGE